MAARRRSLLLNLQILIWTAVVVSLVGEVSVNRQTGRLTLRRRVRQPELEAEATVAVPSEEQVFATTE